VKVKKSQDLFFVREKKKMSEMNAKVLFILDFTTYRRLQYDKHPLFTGPTFKAQSHKMAHCENVKQSEHRTNTIKLLQHLELSRSISASRCWLISHTGTVAGSERCFGHGRVDATIQGGCVQQATLSNHIVNETTHCV
jgi:hypothetical protein